MAFLLYRLQGTTKGRIRRILDILEAKRLLESRNISRLMESGWLENAMAFLEGQTDGEEAAS